MIERISDRIVILTPTAEIPGKAKGVSIGVESTVSETADYLYNPDLADRINTSRESIKEEMGLVRDVQSRQQGRAISDRTEFSSLDMLKRSLARIESLLYQVASVAAVDPDSLEVLQRKLAEELSEYKQVFKSVDLKEIVPPDLNAADIDISRRIDADRIDSGSAASARKAVSTVQDSVDRLMDLIGTERPMQSRAEAILSTTDQNLAAAESALYPEEIMSRAKEASVSVKDRMFEAFGAQAHLQPNHVFKLTSGD